jgi:hypothetical protein
VTTATAEAQIYRSKVKLGEKYKDDRSGLVGYAYGITFHTNGCVDIMLEWYKEGEFKLTHIPEARIIESNQLEGWEDTEYITPIKHDVKYRDVQTGLEGWSATIQFFDSMATRVELRKLSEKDGVQKIGYNSVDDFLLEEIEVKPVAVPAPTDKKSPVMQEERYQENN